MEDRGIVWTRGPGYDISFLDFVTVLTMSTRHKVVVVVCLCEEMLIFLDI